jgi:WD40 repeat protein/serine/threonine protein kinase
MMRKKPIFSLDPDQLERLLSLGTGGPNPGEEQEQPPGAEGKVQANAASGERHQPDQEDSLAHATASLVGLEQPGSLIGRYKLLRILGEGGMGIVYLAEQEGEIRRKVALKVIKPGMDSKRVIARFEAERQALALLDHPNVAQVYDAGTTESGRPYFAMEYVKGSPITDYCDRHRLSIEDRLRLFQEVCLAVHHAHQKGIIHRDLKPSNILVSAEGDRAIPKIIDFGVAKAMSQPLTERTLVTEDSHLLGTPEYMSPEQAEMVNEDIDTRSDIYSLGVLLYVLLAGILPYDSETFRQGGIDHIRKTIRETDPKTPSTRLTKLGEEARKLAESRRTEIAALTRRLHTELEWLPLKAMRKERAERYRSASEMADDIENYLKGVPLIAGPPSTVYRLKKLVRRNKGLFAGVAVVAAILVLGAAVSTWQAARATRAERTQSRLRERAQAGEQLARTHLYAADMVLAQQALDQGNLGRVYELLDKYRPTASDLSPPSGQFAPDLRGWEWRYLWGRSRSDELYTLGSHGRAVDFLAFSDDGTMLVTSDWSNSVKTWDMRARRELAAVSFPSKPRDLCFVPKSPTVAVAVGKEVLFLDASSGRRTSVIPYQSDVSSVAFSRDGSRLATYEGTSLRILDGRAQRVIWQTTVPAGWRVTFSPDGALLAVASNERTVLLLDATNGQQLAPPLSGFSSQALSSLVFSPDGELLACAAGGGGGGGLRVWEVKTRQERPAVEYPGLWIGGVAFSPDGKTLAISGGAHVILLWDRATWQVAGRLQGHLNEAWPVAFSPDGKYLASGGKDKTVRIWDAALKTQETTGVSLPDLSNASSLSTDGSKLCLLTTNNTFTVWDVRTLRPLAQGSLPDANIVHSGRRLVISSDGRKLFTLTPTGQIRVWDVNTREFLAVLEAGAIDPRVLALSPDEKMLAVACRDRTELWDLHTRSPRTTLPGAPSVPCSVAFSADSEIVVIGCTRGEVEAWQISGPRKLWSSQHHTMPVGGLAISPDQRFLAAASNDPQVTLWDLRKGTLIKAFSGALNGYRCVAFSRDGGRLFAANVWPGTLGVWDMGSLQSVGTFQGHRGSVSHLAILSGSDTVVLVGSDGLLLLRAPSFAEIEAAETRPENNQSP